MKKTYLLCALAIAGCGFVFSSCNKVASVLATATGISWSGVDMTIAVPAESDTTVPANVGTGTFSYNLDSLIKSQTNKLLKLSNIDTFEIIGCLLTITNPDANNNFANFETAQLSFSTRYNSTVVNMGEIDNNPDSYATTLSVPVNKTVNLKTYISPLGNTTFNYSLFGKLRRATTASLTVNVHLDYYIHVTP